MKTLLVMRHAKSDWSADHGSDHDRPLNDRGVRSARVMGELLAREDLVPELVISSTAHRARRTAEIAIESGGWDARLVLDPAFYGSGVAEVIEVASSAPPVQRLMLVGHQPTWSMLVAALSGQRVEMKTATVAIIEFGFDDWPALTERRGRVVEVLQPRDHLGSTSD